MVGLRADGVRTDHSLGIFGSRRPQAELPQFVFGLGGEGVQALFGVDALEYQGVVHVHEHMCRC